MSKGITFNIAIPSDTDGFIGRACDSLDCKQYFKIFVQDHKDELYCPYCGNQFSRDLLFTSQQLGHIKEVAIEEAQAYVFEEFQKILKSATRGSKYIKFNAGTAPKKRPISPKYVERQVDTEFQCADCGCRFQVYGIFGYCPGCSCENLLIYDANWNNIKRKLNQETDQFRSLRHAYSDLVSTFEAFCSRKAKHFTQDKGNFQDLYDTRKFFKKHANIDILVSIDEEALLPLRRLFQKRHSCIHTSGKITERYIKKIPEDKIFLDNQVTLTVMELEQAANAMRVALANLVKAIEQPG